MPTDTNEEAQELQPSEKPLLKAGKLSHPDYGYNPIKLPNLNDLIVTGQDANGSTRKRSQ
jgi:hypothetical protein